VHFSGQWKTAQSGKLASGKLASELATGKVASGCILVLAKPAPGLLTWKFIAILIDTSHT